MKNSRQRTESGARVERSFPAKSDTRMTGTQRENQRAHALRNGGGSAKVLRLGVHLRSFPDWIQPTPLPIGDESVRRMDSLHGVLWQPNKAMNCYEYPFLQYEFDVFWCIAYSRVGAGCLVSLVSPCSRGLPSIEEAKGFAEMDTRKSCIWEQNQERLNDVLLVLCLSSCSFELVYPNHSIGMIPFEMWK